MREKRRIETDFKYRTFEIRVLKCVWIKIFLIFYIFIERGVAEMLVHEVSSGQKLLEVVVADVNGDGHADGGPEQKQ